MLIRLLLPTLIHMFIVADCYAQLFPISGYLVSKDGPISYANILIGNGAIGTQSDEYGQFNLKVAGGVHELKFIALGYEEKQMSVSVSSELDLGPITLTNKTKELDPLIVSATMRPVSRSDSPVPVQVLTSEAFRSDPTPSLLGAVAQVNGVNPQLNCSVCNTGDIHINGMEGPYTMVLIDGMPIVSGLSTVYGLSGIPTALIDRVEIIKGPGSALYGSEAMGGIINVITKDALLAPELTGELILSSWGELQVDLGRAWNRNTWYSLLGVNAFNYANPIDNNEDGFTDLALQRRVSIFSKVGIKRPSRKQASLATRFFIEDRWGGEMDWNHDLRGSDSVYGENIETNRIELIGQYDLPGKENIRTQLSLNVHDQDSYYGTVRYKADQRIGFLQTTWKDEVKGHEFLFGASLRYLSYNDNTPATGNGITDEPVATWVPGVFVQDAIKWKTANELLLGYRIDHNRNHGFVHSPRVAYKYKPNGRWALRGGFATGFRVVDIFTEDHAALTGSREVVITENLLPERSINGTLNIIRRFRTQRHYVELDLTLFHSYFENRIVADLDSDPDLIKYSNLDGSGVTQGISFDQISRFGDQWRIRNGVSFMRVYTDEFSEVEQRIIRKKQLFAPEWSGTFTIEREIGNGHLDFTGQWYGPMRLPVQANDFRPHESPWFAHLNMQFRHRLNGSFELFGGVKNILDFVPDDPLMRPFDPFDEQINDTVSNPNGYTFDTTYIYAGLQGRRAFFGIRLNIDD